MNDKIRRVVNGWLNLSPEERREFQETIRQYNEATDSRKTEIRESLRKSLRESATKMETGPLGSPCVCCGR
jgi:hypothetical protein